MTNETFLRFTGHLFFISAIACLFAPFAVAAFDGPVEGVAYGYLAAMLGLLVGVPLGIAFWDAADNAAFERRHNAALDAARAARAAR